MGAEVVGDAGGKVMFIGNGGSAAIAAHLAIDVSNNAGVRATGFNDGSQITCLANDYGFENWIAHAIRLNADADDVLVAISSSGRSANILNGVSESRKLGLPVVTLSGMQPDNPLRALGAVNFWADSHAYNLIETAHQFWMMSVIDLIIGDAVIRPAGPGDGAPAQSPQPGSRHRSEAERARSSPGRLV
jgi:D-sedoheptulose 7-phosphate isomerase